jgi:hypothetical protein
MIGYLLIKYKLFKNEDLNKKRTMNATKLQFSKSSIYVM